MEKRAWIRGKERERRPRHGWITSGRRALTFLLDAQQIKAIWFARVPRLLCPRLPDCRLFFLFALSLSLFFLFYSRIALLLHTIQRCPLFHPRRALDTRSRVFTCLPERPPSNHSMDFSIYMCTCIRMCIPVDSSNATIEIFQRISFSQNQL